MASKPVFFDANDVYSVQAIEYASNFMLSGGKSVQERLYSYGRIPLSSHWVNRFPYTDILSDALTGVKQSLVNQLLITAWSERTAPVNNDRWRLFYNQQILNTASFSVPYKLYINLHPDSLITEFTTIITRLTLYNVPVFKFAKDIYNFVRPDKFVAYLSDFETLLRLGKDLSAVLRSAQVQLLPFTAPFDSSGAVSCGFDPPSEFVQHLNATSWRGFITQIIAQWLKEGADRKVEKKNLTAYVLERICGIGIDNKKWLPKQILYG